MHLAHSLFDKVLFYLKENSKDNVFVIDDDFHEFMHRLSDIVDINSSDVSQILRTLEYDNKIEVIMDTSVSRYYAMSIEIK